MLEAQADASGNKSIFVVEFDASNGVDIFACAQDFVDSQYTVLTFQVLVSADRLAQTGLYADAEIVECCMQGGICHPDEAGFSAIEDRCDHGEDVEEVGSR